MKGQLYLSRRNLLVLLSKLDRKKAGEITACTIIKTNNKPEFQNSPEIIAVTAVEDEEYYEGVEAGFMHPLDTPKSKDPLDNNGSMN